jgi:hypothetical protein
MVHGTHGLGEVTRHHLPHRSWWRAAVFQFLKFSGILLFNERHRCRSALGDIAANAAAFADGRNVLRQLRSGSTSCSMGRIVLRMAVSRQILSRYFFIGSRPGSLSKISIRKLFCRVPHPQSMLNRFIRRECSEEPRTGVL